MAQNSTDRKVHRVLFKNARQHGEDVKALQAAIVARLNARGIKHDPIKHDGVYGPKTHEVALRALYYLGVTRKSVGMKSVNPTGLSHGAQEFIRLLKARNEFQTKRGNRRVKVYNATHRTPPVTVMYDSITLNDIPVDAPAVAGYVNGKWPTYDQVVLRWPKAKHLSIAVNTSRDADCLDVEPGDATNADAPGWVHRQLARGAHRPVVYTSASNANALMDTLARAGISRSKYRLWTAHYTHTPHRCGAACGVRGVADATQWTNVSHGRNLDESLLAPTFF
jgi:hypothetical protein